MRGVGIGREIVYVRELACVLVETGPSIFVCVAMPGAVEVTDCNVWRSCEQAFEKIGTEKETALRCCSMSTGWAECMRKCEHSLLLCLIWLSFAYCWLFARVVVWLAWMLLSRGRNLKTSLVRIVCCGSVLSSVYYLLFFWNFASKRTALFGGIAPIV